jgi:hypothetical protein
MAMIVSSAKLETLELERYRSFRRQNRYDRNKSPFSPWEKIY